MPVAVPVAFDKSWEDEWRLKGESQSYIDIWQTS